MCRASERSYPATIISHLILSYLIASYHPLYFFVTATRVNNNKSSEINRRASKTADQFWDNSNILIFVVWPVIQQPPGVEALLGIIAEPSKPYHRRLKDIAAKYDGK